MKIRVFALAKELGLDSKELIEHCNNAGIQVKNSALASISPEERDTVVNYLNKKPAAEPTQPSDAIAPVRDEIRDLGGRVRQIRTQTEQPPTEAPKADTEEKQIDTEAIEETEDVAATATEDADGQEAQEPGAPDTETPDDGDSPKESDSTPTSPDDAPLTQEDYIPAMGGANHSIREMKPRGTVSGRGGARADRDKMRPKSTMPSIAALPDFKLAKPKEVAKEPPAQKPDIPLTAEILEQQSPLKAHLQEKKRKSKTGDERQSGRGSGIRGREAEQSEAERQRATRTRRRSRQMGDDSQRSARRPMRRRRKSKEPIQFKTSAIVEFPITIRSLSESMGRPANDLLRILMKKGQMITINEQIEEDEALEIALELGVDLEFKRQRDVEEELIELLEDDENEEELQHRPPIITILGHVDHGKTTLVDKLRAANVAAGEAGGITQHIAAYQIDRDGKKLTFVDTPGHAAFGEMRARGANVTDIVVLVVAADDGVMPQTAECISHAKAAGAPIVVALNKIDLPDINEQKVLQELASHDILPAEWGGDTEVVRTSGETGQGLDDLIETILLTAELQEFKANPDRPAVGVCMEAFRDEGRGVISWLVVQRGTLRVGDVILCGQSHGRVRAMYNDRDQQIEEAGPSMPIKIAGLDLVPDAGEHFYVMSDVEEAREAAEKRHHTGRSEALAGSARPRSLEDILQSARTGEVQDLPLIIKADTPGSLEALRGELGKLDHPEVQIRIIHQGVGGVNESDVSLASASGAIVIAFHVIAEDRAAQLADRTGVDIKRYNIIYEVTDTIRRSLEGMLQPERVQVVTGRIIVLQTFKISRFGTIAGCRVLNGTIDRSDRITVIRDQTIINDYPIASLKREKDDAKEVREGMECGIRLDGFNDVKEGDLFEAFRIDEVKRTFEATVQSGDKS